MRRLSAICALVVSAACAPAKPPAITPNSRAAQRLAGADRTLEAGCYDCLVAAYREFDALQAEPSVARTAVLRTIESAALVSQRERELGMADGGYLDIARATLARAADVPAGLTTVLEVVALLPGSSLGPVRPPATDDELARAAKLRANRRHRPARHGSRSEAAARYYGETLTLDPLAAEAKLGKVRARMRATSWFNSRESLVVSL